MFSLAFRVIFFFTVLAVFLGNVLQISPLFAMNPQAGGSKNYRTSVFSGEDERSVSYVQQKAAKEKESYMKKKPLKKRPYKEEQFSPGEYEPSGRKKRPVRKNPSSSTDRFHGEMDSSGRKNRSLKKFPSKREKDSEGRFFSELDRYGRIPR